MTDAAKAEDVLRLVLLEGEQSLLDASTRTSRSRLEALLSKAFVEVGASGRRYTRPQTIETLAKDAGSQIGTIDDFRLVWHSEDAALVSYRYSFAVQGPEPRSSYRVSFWVRDGEAWRILYHQGTSSPRLSAIKR